MSYNVKCVLVAVAALAVMAGLVDLLSATHLHSKVTVTAKLVRSVPIHLPTLALHTARFLEPTHMQAQSDLPEPVKSNLSHQWFPGVFLAAAASAAALLAALKKRTPDKEYLMKSVQLIGTTVVSAAISNAATAASLTFDEIQSLSYQEVKGSGLANSCPTMYDSTGDWLDLASGDYLIENMCLEPSSFKVKVPSDGKTATDFEKTKLITRQTYTLDGIRADLKVSNDGKWSVKEIDGMDYAATTVQLSGGERVPFLFTVKNLEAEGNASQLIGRFDVPSYRGSTFMDPRGRGGSTGYDYQQGLQAAGNQEAYGKENIKDVSSSKGIIALKVAKVDANTGEVIGVFESLQPTDNDMGAKEPSDLKTTGVWYGRISAA